MLSRLKIAFRINLLLALSGFGMLVCAAIGLMALRMQMLEEKRTQLRYVMDLVVNDGREDMTAAGGPQTEAGRAAFLEVLKNAKFGDNSFNFFFAYDYDGLVLWHPDPSKLGKNRSNVVYPNGIKMIPKFLEAARSAPLGGFAEYEGPDNRGSFGPKLSHFRNVPELSVVVGVGANVADVEAAFLARLQVMAWLFAFVMLAIGLASVIVSRSIGEPLSNAVRKIKTLANGDLDIAPADANDRSELGEVDKALDVLRAHAVEQRALQEKVREQTELLMRQHKESEERWRRFVDEVPVSMLMLDRNMVHVACSRRWVELAGLKDGRIGSYHYDIFTQVPEHWKEAHRRALSGEIVGSEEEMFVRLDGVKRWVRWEARPWLANDETIGGITIMSEDVTDRVLAVQALRENELRMRMAQEAAKAGFWESRPSDKINVWSDNLWMLFGLEPGKCRPTRELWLNTIHPDDRELVKAEVRRTAAAGQAFEIQWRANRPEGEPERWLFARGRPISDETPDNYFGVVIDITEQKLMEQALRDSEMRMRLAQEGARAGTWEWRLADDHLEWPEILWSLYGLEKPEHWEPKFAAWGLLIHPEDRQRVITTVVGAAAEGHEFEAQWRLIVPEGEPERWLLIRGRPVAGANGAVDRYFGVVIDITEQKRIEEALRESEMRMRVAQEGAKVGTWEWRLADNSLQWTDALWSIFNLKDPEGWEPSFEGWSLRIHPAYREHAMATVREAATLGHDFEVQWRANLPDDEPERWFLARGGPITDADGKPDRYLGVIIEITGQKLAENALRESEMRMRLAQESAKAGEWELSFADRRLVWPDYLWGEYGIQKPEQWNDTIEEWTSIVHPADREEVMAAFRESTALGRDVQVQYRLNLPEGEPERWILSRGSPVPNPAGPVNRYFGFVIDITEQKLMEKALRESEERQTFLLSLNDALRVTGDPVEAIATASKMLGQKLGVTQVFYTEIDWAGGYATISRDWNDGTVPSPCGVQRLDNFDPAFFGALKSGRTIAISDVRSEPDRWTPKGRAFFERGSMAAVMAVPLVKDGKFLAVLSFQKGFAYDWTKNEISLVLEVAERTWEAVDRARVSQALRESDERLKFAMDAAEVGSWELFLEEGIYSASDRALSLFDLPRKTQPTYQDVIDRTHPDDRRAVINSLQRAAETGQPYKIEFRSLFADGSIHWLDARGERRSISGKQVIGGLIQDITEQKLMEKAVRESEERQTFLLSLNDALRATSDPVGAIAISNRMLGQKLGAAQVFYAEIDAAGKQALIARDWNDGTVPSALALYKLSDFDASFFGVLKSGSTIAVGDVHSESHRWSPAGQALFERGSIAAFIAVPLVKDGKFAALLGLQKGSPHDWTKNEVALAREVAERTWEAVERARVSQALRESEERLKFALTAGEVGTFELAFDTGEIAACDQALALLAFPPGVSVPLESVLARIYPDDLPAFQESLQRTISEGTACSLEWRVQLPDGSVRWLESRGEKRSALGKLVIAGLIQDVTRKVQQQQAVERAAKAKSEFLANMSHELRTPMHAILSFSKFGLKKCASANVPELEEYFGIIRNSGTRLLGLLNDLLDLAKLEAGKMVLKRSHDDFLSVIEHTKVELSPLLAERSIILKTDVQTVNTKSAFDKQRMIQVLINLISNAIKFSPKGSEICVSVMEGRSSDGAELLRCSVGDEGPGIPKDELETVFEQFTQSSQTKTGAGGTGLGLPICREIVKAHGGHIWAENRASKGALFSFVVPRSMGA